MTDFVHEPPKDPTPSPAPQEEKPVSEHERLKKVYTYVAVLFAVAFLLILWTFFMNQRSSQEMLHEIRSGNDAMQNMLDENEVLEARIAELENELDLLKEKNQEQDLDITRYAAQLIALDWLSELEQQYAARDYDAARATIRAIEHDGHSLYFSEPALHTSASGDDYLSPAARYEKIVHELFPNGIN